MFPDLIMPAKTRNHEIHNCQSVIDALSSEVLNIPLTHINGGDVVRGDVNALTNLLEVFSGLFEYILDKIGSDITTDNDGKYYLFTTERSHYLKEVKFVSEIVEVYMSYYSTNQRRS